MVAEVPLAELQELWRSRQCGRLAFAVGAAQIDLSRHRADESEHAERQRRRERSEQPRRAAGDHAACAHDERKGQHRRQRDRGHRALRHVLHGVEHVLADPRPGLGPSSRRAARRRGRRRRVRKKAAALQSRRDMVAQRRRLHAFVDAHGLVEMPELQADFGEFAEDVLRSHASLYGAMERCVTQLRRRLFVRCRDVLQFHGALLVFSVEIASMVSARRVATLTDAVPSRD